MYFSSPYPRRMNLVRHTSNSMMVTSTIHLQLLVVLTVCTYYTLPLPSASFKENKLRNVDWWKDGKSQITARLNTKPIVDKAKNVILFVGDGMGVSTVTAARILKAQEEGRSFHETQLAWEKFPYASLSKTYTVDAMIPDSAATATAFLSGYKTNARTIGVDQTVLRANCDSFTQTNKLTSALEYAHDIGKWTGVVTNTRITHATPAAAYAHSPERAWEADTHIPANESACSDIAKQLVQEHHYIRVVLGGGRKAFLVNKTYVDPEEVGLRADGLDLTKEWEEKQKAKPGVGSDRMKYVVDKAGLDSVKPDQTDYLLGLFDSDHMKYDVERGDQPSLTELVEKAVKILQRSEKGFFLLVEGGRIDHAHHNNTASKALRETLALSKAVDKAVEMTSEEDTLIIATADHSHVFTIAGYTHPDVSILELAQPVVKGGGDEVKLDLAEDGLPWLPLSYSNGPGYYYHRTVNGSLNETLRLRRNLTHTDTTGAGFLNDAMFPRATETHAGEDVIVYARGPMAHLFTGTHEQTFVAHVMMYASCLGPYSGQGCAATGGSWKHIVDYSVIAIAVFIHLFHSGL